MIIIIITIIIKINKITLKNLIFSQKKVFVKKIIFHERTFWVRKINKTHCEKTSDISGNGTFLY